MSTKFSVTKNGIPLDPSLYTWDETHLTFSTTERGLVLDFTGINGATLNTGSECTFKTGNGCTFTTGWGCTFNTGRFCIFTTGSECTFKTGSWCVFTTGWHCTFITEWECTFKTENYCTFTTGNGCTFTTGNGCTFNTGNGCTFKTKGESSLTYTWNNCYELYKLDNSDVEYRINLDGSLTINQPETEEQRKIRELKETIDKAQQQIEELQKNKR